MATEIAIMSDKLPSLFDFDDEDFFPKPENPEEKTADPTGPQPAVDTGEEPQVPRLTGEESADGVLAVEMPLDNNIAGEVAEIQEKEVAESLSKDYIKPKLELPDQAATDDFGKLSDTQAFDKQIGNAYQQKAAAFTFEPRKDTKAEEVIYQPESLEVKDMEPADLPGIQSDAESNDENILAPEVIIEPLPEWTLDKNYYTIGEVAQLFEVNVSHIRFWTIEFKMKTRTTRKGDRLYTPAQIGELRLIHHLVKIKKYTLKGAKEILKSGNIQLEKKLNLKEELQKLYQELLALKDSL